jgi:hypothetical protein
VTNSNLPTGLQISFAGGPIVLQAAYFDTSEANDIYEGDPVILAGSSINGLPTIKKAAVTDQLYGVIIQANCWNTSNLRYRPASTQTLALIQLVYASTEFICQLTGTTSADDVGLNGSLVFGTGDKSTGFGNVQFDGSTKATTNTLVWLLKGIDLTVPNTAGTYTKGIIRQNSFLRTGV